MNQNPDDMQAMIDSGAINQLPKEDIALMLIKIDQIFKKQIKDIVTQHQQEIKTLTNEITDLKKKIDEQNQENIRNRQEGERKSLEIQTLTDEITNLKGKLNEQNLEEQKKREEEIRIQNERRAEEIRIQNEKQAEEARRRQIYEQRRAGILNRLDQLMRDRNMFQRHLTGEAWNKAWGDPHTSFVYKNQRENYFRTRKIAPSRIKEIDAAMANLRQELNSLVY